MPSPPSDAKADECCYGLLLGECKVRIGQASRFRPGSLCDRRPASPLPGFLAGTRIGLGHPSDRPAPRALLRLPRRSPTFGLPHGAGPCFSLLDLRAFTLQRPDSDVHRHPYLSSARVKSHKHLLLGRVLPSEVTQMLLPSTHAQLNPLSPHPYNVVSLRCHSFFFERQRV